MKQGISDGIKTGGVEDHREPLKYLKVGLQGHLPFFEPRLCRTWEQCQPIVTEVFKLSKYFAASLPATKVQSASQSSKHILPTKP